MISTMTREIRYSLRTLIKSRGFTAAALLALALGIGANSAVFSLVNAVLLRPLPYEDPAGLVDISELDAERQGLPVDYLDFVEWRAQADAFKRMAFQATFTQTLTGAGLAENLPVGFVTADFFGTLGVRPILGRDFVASDDRKTAPPVAILSYRFWQNRFGGDRGVLGRTLRLGQRNFTIVGVLPSSFRYHRPGQVYVAFGPCLSQWGMDQRGNHNNAFVVARLKPGVSIERARAQMDTIARRLEAQFPLNRGIGAAVRPLRELFAGGVRSQMLILLGAVAFVLLIACVNVANLMLVRSAARRKEIAVRAALGARRLRLIGQLLTESILLSMAAALLGLLLAEAAFDVLAKLLPWGFEAADVSIDWAVLAFTLSVGCSTGILFGIVPALQATDFSLSEALKESGRFGDAASARRKLRSALVIAQVAISMVLLAGAGLLARSFWRLVQVSPGFEVQHVLTMDVSWPYWEILGVAGAVDFHKRLCERVEALPGVRAVGGIWPLPLGTGGAAIPIYRAGKPVPAQGQCPVVAYHRATPGLFSALGIPLLRGRIFTAADGTPPRDQSPAQVEAAWRASTLAAVISESMARRFWPGEDPVGRRFRFGPPEFNGPWVQVLGVVGDIKGAGLDQPAEAEFYLSAYLDPNDLTLVVRSGGDPAALAAAVRTAIAELDRNVPVDNVRTMDKVLADGVSRRRTNMLLIGAFAMLALVLAAVGLYGVMAYLVAQRRHEIGVRIALGASGADVASAVVKEAGLLALAGVGLGTLGALALTRLLANLLFGLAATDPATFGAAAAVLLAVAVAASWAPARRAARVDPIVALRCQ
ncbi:MAG TPA: ABC transporter permease [Bryobacteraceae bacterium]|nr:ABC transporter permease [Bryobacteraceae bacterium]